MVADIQRWVFEEKAAQNLESAVSELVNRRYDACANRCYYSAFHAAIVALLRAGIQPRGTHGIWGHDYVQAQFSGQLIGRRKLYPAELRTTLPTLLELREVADYEATFVSRREAERAVRRVEQFVESIIGGGDTI